MDIVQSIAGRFHDRRIIFAIQVYEKLNVESLAVVQAGWIGPNSVSMT